MKAVLISIQPKWCELIASGKKTIEVRKMRPKIETPFKCYIYCTKAKEDRYILERLKNNKFIRMDGKVIGEFVCDEMIEDKRGENTDVFSKFALLSLDEQKKYGANKPLYGWHITEPKLFDKPKELGEFCVPCKKYNDSELHCMEWDCEHYSFFPDANGDAEEECLCKRRKPLRRPPQSWCYVEELQ